MKFKHPELYVEYEQYLHPLTRELLSDIQDEADALGQEIVITSVARPDDKNKSSNHIPRDERGDGVITVRACDIRSRDWTTGNIGEICKRINSRWIYDESRPDQVCLLYHNQGKGWHFHAHTHTTTYTLDNIHNWSGT